MTVVTRFAPSPTGTKGLHIGGARTALFNYLYARHHGGKFKLRIEDTDPERNTPESRDSIFDGLSWLGLSHDGEVVFQSQRAMRHRDVAFQMLESGHAYADYTTREEMDALKAEWSDKHPNAPFRYVDNPYRNGKRGHNTLISPVIRLIAPREGSTVIEDAVQGRVEIQNSVLDDMILLRSDKSPTYMLAVVVDDHDARVNTVIRGDDHLNNAFRQLPIYRAMGWPEPTYAHIPLIHDEQGNKYSKRSGACAVGEYAEKGILPHAMINYLVKLGWGHGDDEIMSLNQMVEWFDLPGIGRAPARFDWKKLTSINAHYLREADDNTLVFEVLKAFPDHHNQATVDLLRAAMPSLKIRSTTIVELIELVRFYIERPHVKVDYDFTIILGAFPDQFSRTEIEASFRKLSETTNAKLKDLITPVRLAITGSTVSPPMFEAMELLGREEVLTRLAGSRRKT